MKPLFFGIFIFVLCALLSACNFNGTKGDVVLQEAQLDEFSKHMLSLLSNEGFVFDVKVSKNVGEMKVTIDLYEKGKFIQTVLEGGLSGDTKLKSNKLIIANDSINNSLQKWSMGSYYGEEWNQIESIEDKKREKHTESIASAYITEPLAINKGEKRALGALVSTKDNRLVMGDLDAVLKNPEATSKFARVYLIQLELK